MKNISEFLKRFRNHKVGVDRVSTFEVDDSNQNETEVDDDKKTPILEVKISSNDQEVNVVEKKKNIKIRCTVCTDKYRESKLVRICKQKNCDNKICNNCVRNICSEPKRGSNVLQNQLSCPFCRSMIKRTIIQRYRHDLVDLLKDMQKMDQQWYYGWCKDCGKIRKAIEKSCAQSEIPKLKNFSCDECHEKQVKKLIKQSKPCPRCGIQTHKANGCNHIRCTKCRVNWCYVCGYKAIGADKVYNHMRIIHKSIDQKKIDYDLVIPMDTSEHASSESDSDSSYTSYDSSEDSSSIEIENNSSFSSSIDSDSSD